MAGNKNSKKMMNPDRAYSAWVVNTVAAGMLFVGGCAFSPKTTPLPASDRNLAVTAVQRALEHQLSSTSYRWGSDQTGNSGSVTPTRTYTNQFSMFCRDFIETITINGQTQRYHDTACRDHDGVWKPFK